jgi:FkbM family methyltransferase
MKLNSNLANDNVITINSALYDKVGEVELFSYGSDVINSLTPTAAYAARFGEPVCQKISVKTTTIDEFCISDRIGVIDILKVDAEGVDLQVLQGAKRKLTAHDIRFICVEFNTIFDKPGRTGGALAPICELLEGFGCEFVTSYTDYVTTEGDFFAVHNALFHASPGTP